MKTSVKLLLASMCFLPLSAATALAATNIIQVFNFDFGSATSAHVDPTINLGDTVEWVWANGTHTTTAAAGQLENWDSGLQGTPFTFDHTFTQLGTFNYYCSLHGFDAGGGQVAGMSGYIHVVMPVQDVRTYIAAGKGQLFDQTDASTLTMSDAGFVFTATVRGTATNTVVSATDQTPGGTTKVLAKESPDSDTFQFEESFTSKSALDAAYTNGTYAMTIATADDGTLTPSLNLPGNAYPNTPQIMNLAAAQTIGASSNFVVMWNTFSSGTTKDLVRFEIDNASGLTVTNSPEFGDPGQLDGTAVSFLIAADTLDPNAAYTGTVEFVKITTRDTNSVPGAIGITAYMETTHFPLGTFPPPAVSCLLVPALATNDIGTMHSVTLTITTNGTAVAGVTVDFAVISGPNTGANGSGMSDDNGQAVFSYSSSVTGTDTIQASSLSSMCTATKVWSAPNLPPVAICQDVTTTADASCLASVPATQVDNNSFDPDGMIVGRTLSPPGPYGMGSTPVTLTVTDNRGVTNACLATITVLDQTAPTISCPVDIITTALPGQTAALISYPPSTVTDNCSVSTITCVPPSGSTFPVGTNRVTCTAVDGSGNTNSCTFNVVVSTVVHDLAVISIKAPNRVALTTRKGSQTKSVRVTIQNRSDHDEAIASVDVLNRLVTLALESLATNCVAPPAQLVAGLPQGPLPANLRRKQKLTVNFRVTFDCANDPLAGRGHEDFRYIATVHHEAIDGQPDSYTADDVCPHDAPPGGVDPYDRTIRDNGCGGKKPDGTLGAPVTTDVVIR